MLFALSRVIRKNGIAEAEVSNVSIQEIKYFIAFVHDQQVIDAHIKFVKQHGIYPIPSHADLFSVMASLAAQKLVTVESSRLDYYQRIKADVSDSGAGINLEAGRKDGIVVSKTVDSQLFCLHIDLRLLLCIRNDIDMEIGIHAFSDLSFA